MKTIFLPKLSILVSLALIVKLWRVCGTPRSIKFQLRWVRSSWRTLFLPEQPAQLPIQDWTSWNTTPRTPSKWRIPFNGIRTLSSNFKRHFVEIFQIAASGDLKWFWNLIKKIFLKKFQKLKPLAPFQVFYSFGRKSVFRAIASSIFSEKLNFIQI